ncbi:nuclear transport factor 2 family protein [Mycolicibacterium moriokaense]|uniref:SnoaL-like protein n=1 Tax=Mycolicibacterium moriokaense TaxID=39691 RepID=A0A318HCT4_9MYCO|nr:nuclear transport factor 2 family protein [Mycolicibacterium moriokaense]PXX06051.1 SnoaL-like protein [Mycolicibacterium moriokaense]
MDADKEQIAEVLIRYATGIDSKDWPLLRSCWTDEIDVDYQQLGRFTSADALTDVMRQLHENMGPTYHRLSNFVIAVDGDRATARSYVQAVLMLQPNDSTNWVDALGHYDDVFVRTPNGWRISERVSRTARTLTGGDIAAAATKGRI